MATQSEQARYTNNAATRQLLDSLYAMYAKNLNVSSSLVSIRLGFLRKVYGILSIQLLFTTIVGVAFLTFWPLQYYLANIWGIIFFGILSLALVPAMEGNSRKFPTNYLLLAAFTFCESFVIGAAVTRYDVGSVVVAFGLTCAVTCALTLYTFQSKRDFSAWGAGLISSLWILVLLLFFQCFFHGNLLPRALAGVGAILFSLFIIYDTQMIMNRVSSEEYIMATTCLYLDIINLFLNILKFFGKRND